MLIRAHSKVLLLVVLSKVHLFCVVLVALCMLEQHQGGRQDFDIGGPKKNSGILSYLRWEVFRQSPSFGDFWEFWKFIFHYLYCSPRIKNLLPPTLQYSIVKRPKRLDITWKIYYKRICFHYIINLVLRYRNWIYHTKTRFGIYEIYKNRESF